MTIVDLKEQRQARWRAERDRWDAWQERELAKARRVLDVLAPLVEQLLKQKKVRARHPRCEALGCWSTITTLHPVQGRTSEDAPALVALCDRHLGAVRSGRMRVNAEGADALSWQLYDRPDAPPRLQIKLPRRRASRAGAHRRAQ